ncbi:MAG: glycosyltransferase 9 family protein [Herminiimonas sp.]|nr:glycosyltransferase 9 family protein [Herminiimonas sp.]
MIEGVSHVLICRTDNIGDVVLTLPLAGYLKKLNPQLRIGFLCRGYAAGIVRYCQAVDYVLESEHLGDAADMLRRLGPDTIVFAKPDRHLAAAAKKAGIRNRVGTSHRWFHWLYCNRLAHFSRVKSGLHEAQLNFKLLAPLGENVVPPLEQIPPLYRLVAPPYTGHPALATDRFNLVIHPKSNGNGREWPIGHYTALAEALRNSQVQMWVTGSGAEGEWIAEHAPALLAMPHVGNVCGRLTLAELACFINAADGLIASGTGPLHLSAALGRPTLGLFPPIRPINPGRWGALGAQAEVLCQPLPCGACDDAANCECMNAITPQSVAAVVQRWLSRSTAHRVVEPVP